MPVAVLHPRWERHRELDELVVEERLAALDRARHRDAIHPREQQLGQALPKLEIGHALEEIGIASRALALVPDPLHSPQRVVLAVTQQSVLERAPEAERAAPVRDAAVAGVVERLAVADGRPARAVACTAGGAQRPADARAPSVGTGLRHADGRRSPGSRGRARRRPRRPGRRSCRSRARACETKCCGTAVQSASGSS